MKYREKYIRVSFGLQDRNNLLGKIQKIQTIKEKKNHFDKIQVKITSISKRVKTERYAVGDTTSTANIGSRC